MLKSWCIGMLLQEHVEQLLTANIPAGFEEAISTSEDNEEDAGDLLKATEDRYYR